MSDYTQTPVLGLFKPTYNADAEQWGYHLNANADTIDAAFGAGTTFLHITGGTLSGPGDLTVGGRLTLTIGSVTFTALPVNAANDAAASVAGVPVGGVYRNGGILMVRVT